MNYKWTGSPDLLLCHLPPPYHVHLLTLDFYLNLMDDSPQPLEDLLQDMKPNFCLKFHSHSSQYDEVSTSVKLWTPSNALQVMVFAGSLLLLVYRDLYI